MNPTLYQTPFEEILSKDPDLIRLWVHDTIDVMTTPSPFFEPSAEVVEINRIAKLRRLTLILRLNQRYRKRPIVPRPLP